MRSLLLFLMKSKEAETLLFCWVMIKCSDVELGKIGEMKCENVRAEEVRII